MFDAQSDAWLSERKRGTGAFIESDSKALTPANGIAAASRSATSQLWIGFIAGNHLQFCRSLGGFQIDLEVVAEAQTAQKWLVTFFHLNLFKLFFNYEMLQGTFGAGSPRIDLNLPGTTGSVVGYIGTPLGGGNFDDPFAGAPGMTDNLTNVASTELRWHSSGFAAEALSDGFHTWDEIEISLLQNPVSGFAIILDGGGGSVGTQEMLVSDLHVDNTLYNPLIPTPEPCAGVLVIVGVLVGISPKLRRRSSPSAAQRASIA